MPGREWGTVDGFCWFRDSVCVWWSAWGGGVVVPGVFGFWCVDGVGDGSDVWECDNGDGFGWERVGLLVSGCISDLFLVRCCSLLFWRRCLKSLSRVCLWSCSVRMVSFWWQGRGSCCWRGWGVGWRRGVTKWVLVGHIHIKLIIYSNFMH